MSIVKKYTKIASSNLFLDDELVDKNKKLKAISSNAHLKYGNSNASYFCATG